MGEPSMAIGFGELKVFSGSAHPDLTREIASFLGVEPGQVGEAGSRTTVLALGDPPARGDARKIEGDGNAAQAIIDFIAEKRLI